MGAERLKAVEDRTCSVRRLVSLVKETVGRSLICAASEAAEGMPCRLLWKEVLS